MCKPSGTMHPAPREVVPTSYIGRTTTPGDEEDPDELSPLGIEIKSRGLFTRVSVGRCVQTRTHNHERSGPLRATSSSSSFIETASEVAWSLPLDTLITQLVSSQSSYIRNKLTSAFAKGKKKQRTLCWQCAGSHEAESNSPYSNSTFSAIAAIRSYPSMLHNVLSAPAPDVLIARQFAFRYMTLGVFYIEYNTSLS